MIVVVIDHAPAPIRPSEEYNVTVFTDAPGGREGSKVSVMDFSAPSPAWALDRLASEALLKPALTQRVRS